MSSSLFDRGLGTKALFQGLCVTVQFCKQPKVGGNRTGEGLGTRLWEGRFWSQTLEMFIPTFYTTTLDMPMRFTGALRHLTWRNLQWLHYRPPSLLMHNFTPNLHPFQVRSCHYHVQPTHSNWQQQGPQRYLYLFLLGELLWLLVKKVGHLY